MNMEDNTNTYPVIGRHPDIDLAKYIVNIRGRDIINYEKLKNDDPTLYQKIIDQEYERNRQDAIEREGENNNH